MDTSSIELPGCKIDSITLNEGLLRIHFSHAYIVKTMQGSLEKTRWWQAGELVINGASLIGKVPKPPLVCVGGDVGENVYTYRDMIPIPLESRGLVRCDLQFQGSDERLVARGEAIRLALSDVPKYIEHIRPLTP